MLPVDGNKTCDFPWDDFDYEQVLIYYDGPRLILQQSGLGQLYLSWWNDTDELIDRWICLPVSTDRLRTILSGSISVMDALREPENGALVVVDEDLSTGKVVNAVWTDIAHIPQDSLPSESSRLNMPFPEEIMGMTNRE